MGQGIQEIIGPHSAYKVDTSVHEGAGGFGSSEHLAIGESVTLRGLPANSPLLRIGLTPIYFQDVVTLAGDFYADPKHAISLPGGTPSDKTNRFKQALEKLLTADANQVRQILNIIKLEYASVRHSGLPHHCYSSQLVQKDREINKIKKDVTKLLIDNSDHFYKNAADAYTIGHTYALEVAKLAGQQKDLGKLKEAYLIDGFACHFFTDLFASGHARNQRGELELFLKGIGFSNKWAKPLAGLLTGAQHEYDGRQGLNVKNKFGQWRAYGDGCYFSKKNEDNQKQVHDATQASVDEIFQVYENPNNPDFLSQMSDWIPEATEFNPPPIYHINEDGSILTLQNGIEQREIKCQKSLATRNEFLYQGISQALRYLPEDYVN